MMIADFLRAEDGVATVDWIVLLAGLVGLGLWMWNVLGDQVLAQHAVSMRSELQDPHFETDWFDYVAVLPPSME